MASVNPLAAFLVEKGIRPSDFCDLRKPRPFPASLVSEWIRGLRHPSYASMVDIEAATGGGVPVSAWPVRRRAKRQRKQRAA